MSNFDNKISTNYKSLLLEKCQESTQYQPKYEVISESGPDHNKEFLVSVIVNNSVLASGKGKTKKAAEQEAAKSALEKDLNFI
jgi:ribonuclease-3